MEICNKRLFFIFWPSGQEKIYNKHKDLSLHLSKPSSILKQSKLTPSILYHILNKNDFIFEKNSTVCTVCTVCSLQSVFLHDRNFHGGFWQYMANRHMHDGPWSALQFPNRSQSFQRTLLVLWNLDYILSQNNYIPFHTMEILVHNDERTISNSLPCL